MADSLRQADHENDKHESNHEPDEMSSEQEMFTELHGFVRSIFSKKPSHSTISSTDEDSKDGVGHIEKGLNLTDIFHSLDNKIGAPQSRYRKSTVSVFRHVATLAQTVHNYLLYLEKQQLTKLCNEVHQSAGRWISDIFRYENGYCYFSPNKFSGINKVCKLALHLKYSKYFTDGFTALYTRPPVVYVSSAAPQGFGREIRNQLGLPQSSICTVPCHGNQATGSGFAIDVAAFERLLTDDVSCGKTPLVLIAFAGTPLAGHTDNLSRLREICTQAGVWLHVEGDSLATLALDNIPQSVQAATSADSLAINMSNWLSLSTLPSITLYRTSNPSMAVASGLVSLNHMEQLDALPLWMTMSFLGLEVVKETIKHACVLAEQLSNRLDQLSSIKRIEQAGAISTTVLFKYKANPPMSYSSSSSPDDEDDDDDASANQQMSRTRPALAPRGPLDVSSRLRDAFNQMLVERLQQHHSKVAVDVVTVPVEGSCIRFQPLQYAVEMGTSSDDVDRFAESLQNDTIAMDSLLLLRDSFTSTFRGLKDLTLIDVTDVPAIGAFQCMPRYWKSNDVTNLSDSKKRECNVLTSEVYSSLAQSYPEVRQGRTATGLVCIHVGLPTKDFNVSVFQQAVINITTELEDNSQYLESLTESIQKSIKEAQQTLEKESEEKFFEDGVLRSVPVFGSVYNWLSPPSKGTGVRGRTFDLSSGKLNTTESTYKLKMQVNDDTSIESAEDTHEASDETTEVSPESSINDVTAAEETNEDLENNFNANVVESDV